MPDLPWLICFAVKEEAGPFRRLAREVPNLQTLVTGMGWRNAEAAFRAAVAKARPGRVVTSGFAGGLNPALRTGALVYSRQSSLQMPERASAVARPALFHCAQRIATTTAEKERIRKETGADVIEMESGIIERVCRESGVPCLTLRVVLDAAGEDLPLDFGALLNEREAVDPVKLGLALARNPGRISALIQFQKRVKQCASVLGNGLRQVVLS